MITKAEIQGIKALADKRGRVEQGCFIAEGEKLVAELRASHLAVRKVYATKPLWSDVEVIAERDQKFNKSITFARFNIHDFHTPFNKISRPQGRE